MLYIFLFFEILAETISFMYFCFMQKVISKYQIQAKKSLGQNFLQDDNILQKIATLCHITGENIIEVGPGYGALTQKLLSYQPNALTLVELDRDMVEVLWERIAQKELNVEWISFEILSQDVLQYTPNFSEYKVVANIPYYITSPILYHFLYEVPHLPKEMILLMQKEVGERILSQKSSVLSLFVQKKCSVWFWCLVPRDAFFPIPKVDSIVLIFQSISTYDEIDDEFFLIFIKKAFSHPRKKMLSNLVSSWYRKDILENVFQKLWYRFDIRAEAISFLGYIEMMKELRKLDFF